MSTETETIRVNRFPAWIVPAFLFALFINVLLFLLLPMLTQVRTPRLDMTDPVSVNLVRVREQEPPPPEEEAFKEPKPREPRNVPEVFRPELIEPMVKALDMPAVRFEWNTELVGTTGLDIRMIYEASELDRRPEPLVRIDPV